MNSQKSNSDSNKPIIKFQDAREFLDSIEDHSVDLLLTEPPYSTEVDNIYEFASSWVQKAFTKIKPSGRAYIFIGYFPEDLGAYMCQSWFQRELELADIISWHYKNLLKPFPKMDFVQCYQGILHFHGKEAKPLHSRILNELNGRQEFNTPYPKFGECYHTWEKPNKLVERLIVHSTKKGDLIIDPFAGAGTFLLAAKTLGRKSIGSEISQEIGRIAEGRGCVSES